MPHTSHTIIPPARGAGRRLDSEPKLRPASGTPAADTGPLRSVRLMTRIYEHPPQRYSRLWEPTMHPTGTGNEQVST